MSTNTAAFTPEIINKIARYKDDQLGIGRPPEGGYFVQNGSIMFYEGTPENIIMETTLNHFDGEDYFIADLAYGEDVPLGCQALSIELLDRY
ncbi:hypothetical protein QX776_07360 [Alteromonadaceae bacterium BrNp21-10]|nr:hypothetical protein [Alteromonadaceae bacterium BrNp21-10]